MTRPTTKRKKAPKTSKLTARQAAFCRAYFAGPTLGNATQSARAAGYTGDDNTVASTASTLLRNPKVAEELERLRQKAESKTIADGQSTLLMLSQTQRGEVQVPLGIHAGRVIYGPPKASDRIQAAKLRAQIMGELRETHDVDVTVSGPNGGPVQVQHVPPSVARAELLAGLTKELGAVEAERMVRRMLGEPEPVALEAPKEGT